MKNAILFKTHFWDDVVERNFRLCKRYAKHSDIFIIFDPDAGHTVPEPHYSNERIFYTPYSSIEKIGLEWGMHTGGGFWYNGDYQQNLFILSHPEYEYICSIENDVSTHISIDNIFNKMHENGVDVIYHPQNQPNSQWSHFDGCSGYYDQNFYINKGLFCVSFFSRRAALLILHRRLEMSTARRSLSLPNWPIGECVMAQEPINAGMIVDHLINYCDNLEQYDWAPCYLTCEADSNEKKTFSHPVTNFNNKFIVSNFVQDYNSLCSYNQIISGKSRQRARRISDLEVYCRLFNSRHVQKSSDYWRPILNDVSETISPEILDILGGKTWLTTKHIKIEKNTGIHDSPELLTSPLPQWDDVNNNCFFEIGEKIKITSILDKKSKLIICSKQVNIKEYIEIYTHNNDNICGEYKGKVRELIFTEYDVDYFSGEIIINIKKDVCILSIRLCDGTGRGIEEPLIDAAISGSVAKLG